MRDAEPARGVLTRGDDRTHQRVLPCSELAHCIAHFWWVAWDLDAPFVAETLPHPTAHLVFETQRVASRTRSSASLHGAPPRRFTRTLRGRGRAFGVKLRPGAL